MSQEQNTQVSGDTGAGQEAQRRFKPESASFMIRPLVDFLGSMSQRDRLVFALANMLSASPVRDALEHQGLYEGDIYEHIADDCDHEIKAVAKNGQLTDQERAALKTVAVFWNLTM